jgi:hypothetical protein
MHSTALSTVVALPVDETSSKLREYTYRSIIGRARSHKGMVTLGRNDDVTESGDLEFFTIDGNHTRVVLTLDTQTDELTAARHYSRFLDGFRLFAEGEGRPAAGQRQVGDQARDRRAA